MLTNTDLSAAMPIHLDGPLPPMPTFRSGVRRAPDRGFRLSRNQTAVAMKNALRYVPAQHHAELIPEFFEELKTRGGSVSRNVPGCWPKIGRPSGRGWMPASRHTLT